jgi:hypothetical protein
MSFFSVSNLYVNSSVNKIIQFYSEYRHNSICAFYQDKKDLNFIFM